MVTRILVKVAGGGKQVALHVHLYEWKRRKQKIFFRLRAGIIKICSYGQTSDREDRKEERLRK